MTSTRFDLRRVSRSPRETGRLNVVGRGVPPALAARDQARYPTRGGTRGLRPRSWSAAVVARIRGIDVRSRQRSSLTSSLASSHGLDPWPSALFIMRGAPPVSQVHRTE